MIVTHTRRGDFLPPRHFSETDHDYSLTHQEDAMRMIHMSIIAMCFMLLGSSARAQELPARQEDQFPPRELSTAERLSGIDLRPIENSLASLSGTFKDATAKVYSIYEAVRDSPQKVVEAWRWCVDSVIWCIYAVLFAYGQRLYMLWFGVWRPRE